MTEELQQAIVECATVLRNMEWSKIRSETGWSSSGFCPICDAPKFGGHKRTCALGNALIKSARALKNSESGGTADAVVSNTTA